METPPACVLLLAISIVSAFTGCVEMAMTRDINRLEKQHQAGLIPDDQYALRHSEMEQRLALHQQAVTDIMASAAYSYTDEYGGGTSTQSRYVQTSKSGAPNPAPSGSTYVQSARFTPRNPQPERHTPTRYVQTQPHQPQGVHPESYTPQTYVQGTAFRPAEPKSENYSTPTYVPGTPHQPGDPSPERYRPAQYFQNSGRPGTSSPSARTANNWRAPAPGKITANPAIVLQQYNQAIERLARTEPKAAAFRRWWDTYAVPVLAKELLGFGQSDATKKLVEEAVKQSPQAKSLGVKQVLEGLDLAWAAVRESR